MFISWVQAGYGNWSMTGNGFYVNSSGSNSYQFHEHDNGVGMDVPPGDPAVHHNSVDAFGNSAQSQTSIGSFANYAFTFSLTRNLVAYAVEHPETRPTKEDGRSD